MPRHDTTVSQHANLIDQMVKDIQKGHDYRADNYANNGPGRRWTRAELDSAKDEARARVARSDEKDVQRSAAAQADASAFVRQMADNLNGSLTSDAAPKRNAEINKLIRGERYSPAKPGDFNE